MDELFLNDDSSLLYGGGSVPMELEPMYSGLTSGNTLRQWQQQNNLEEVKTGLS